MIVDIVVFIVDIVDIVVFIVDIVGIVDIDDNFK